MNTTEAARLALACLDLTSLNDGDTESDIEALCRRACGPHGNVAAVCVWPRFVALARARLPATVRVAAVANFPDGSADIERAVRDTQTIVDSGGQEVDVVIPYCELAAAPALLDAVRRAASGLTLKVILETGVLADTALIEQACRIALQSGADFLKTSTGKTAVSATPAAAELLLRAIAGNAAIAANATINAIAANADAHSRVGFKAAGGIRSVADAAIYLELTRRHLGDAALSPARFRIGASSVLADIEAVLAGQPGAAPAASGVY